MYIMKIAFLGDSITFGYGIRKKENWVTKSAEKLQIEAVNLGMVGDTTGGLLVRFHMEVLPQKPQILFVMGGYNDIFISESDLDARSNVMAIVHQSIAKGITPILGIPPGIMGADAKAEWAALVDFNKASELCEDYCQWLRKFAQTFQIPVVDFNQEFARCIQENADETWYLDGLHPNLKGQGVMADIFCKKVKWN